MQAERSSAAPLPRTEPASNRPQLFDFPEHRPRVRIRRASGRCEVPLSENCNDQQMEQALFPSSPASAIWRKHPEPDWTHIHQELQTHKDLTLQLVWQEGRERDPEGYDYSRFCDLYRR